MTATSTLSTYLAVGAVAVAVYWIAMVALLADRFGRTFWGWAIG